MILDSKPDALKTEIVSRNFLIGTETYMEIQDIDLHLDQLLIEQ